MENFVNKVVLSGCAGSDAEVKTVAGNIKLARVNMAVNESYRNAEGEEIKKTQWFSLTFWNAKADIAELKIKKGTRFTIEGRLQNNNYQAKDGTMRYTTEIVVDEVAIKELEMAN
jgi:single-strand DNA-binding protein